MKKVINKSITFVAGIASMVLLQACSGHPGAGHWESSLEAPISRYSALELEFDGKGTLHPNKLVQGQEEKADLWCIWQAKSATALDVQCGDGAEEKTNIKLELVVVGEKSDSFIAYTQAELRSENKVVATFIRKR